MKTVGKAARQKKMAALGIKPGLPHSLEAEQRLNRVERGPVLYKVKDQLLDRAGAFAFICLELQDGVVNNGQFDDPPDLVDLCSIQGMPRLSEVMAWCRVNPDWRAALTAAEQVAAMRRVNEARRIARAAQGSPQAGGSKLAVDMLTWEASKLDRKWAEKQIVVDETAELHAASTDALVEQLVAAVLAQPKVLAEIAPLMKNALPPEAQKRIEEAARQAVVEAAITVEAL